MEQIPSPWLQFVMPALISAAVAIILLMAKAKFAQAKSNTDLQKSFITDRAQQTEDYRKDIQDYKAEIKSLNDELDEEKRERFAVLEKLLLVQTKHEVDQRLLKEKQQLVDTLNGELSILRAKLERVEMKVQVTAELTREMIIVPAAQQIDRIEAVTEDTNAVAKDIQAKIEE